MHIEMLNSLDSDAWMMAITKSMPRQGRPQTVSSDNGTNTVRCARKNEEPFNQKHGDNTYYQLERGLVNWKFSSFEVRHFGGFRKDCFEAARKLCLNFSELTFCRCHC